MSQQINLYSPLFRKQKKVFSALAMVQAMGLVVVAVAGFYFYVALQGSLLEIRAADSRQQLAGELERLKVYSARETPETHAKALAEQRKSLEAALAERRRMAQALADSGFGRNDGYSELLRTLARVSMDGLWLTRIYFSEQDGEVAIAGRATRAELVAVYLERLRAQSALRGQAFASLEIKRAPAGVGAGVVEFVLSSNVAQDKAKP